MNISGIELELQEVSEVTQKKREERQTYLTRLMRAVADIPDAIWSSLSKDAQDWNNEAATAFKEGRDIDDFPEEEQQEEEETNVEPSEAEEEPIEDTEAEALAETSELPIETPTRRGRGRPPKPRDGSEPQPAMVTKVRGKNTSACHKIKRMVVQKPYIMVDEIAAKLAEEGLKVTPVTIATLRSSVRDTLRVLNEVGLGEFKLNKHSVD